MKFKIRLPKLTNEPLKKFEIPKYFELIENFSGTKFTEFEIVSKLFESKIHWLCGKYNEIETKKIYVYNDSFYFYNIPKFMVSEEYSVEHIYLEKRRFLYNLPTNVFIKSNKIFKNKIVCDILDQMIDAWLNKDILHSLERIKNKKVCLAYKDPILYTFKNDITDYVNYSLEIMFKLFWY